MARNVPVHIGSSTGAGPKTTTCTEQDNGIQARPVSAPSNDSSHSGKQAMVQIITFTVVLLCLGSCVGLILISSLAQPCGPLDELRGKTSGCLQVIDPGGRGQTVRLSFSAKRPTLNILQYNYGAHSGTDALGRLAMFDLPNGRIVRTVDLPSGESLPSGEFIDDEVRYGDTYGTGGRVASLTCRFSPAASSNRLFSPNRNWILTNPA